MQIFACKYLQKILLTEFLMFEIKLLRGLIFRLPGYVLAL